MAYTTATVIQEDPPLPDGRVHLVIQFTGNAGEPPINRDYYLDTDTTALDGRIWVAAEKARLNNRKTLADTISVGTVIPDPPAPPGPTAFETWRAKAHRLVAMDALNKAGSTAAAFVADLGALRTDVNTSYSTSFASLI